jgi:hypothetical protein
MCKKVVLMLTAPLLVAMLFGCGKKETYRTRDGEVTVNKKSGEVTFETKTKDGNVKVSASETGVALPDGFPKDLPIYKDAKVQMATTQGKTMMVHLATTAPAAEALKYYQDQLKEQGWEIGSTMNMGEGSMITAKKGNRECSALILKQDKGLMIQLTVTEKDS